MMLLPLTSLDSAASPGSAAGASELHECPGCLEHPDPACAACGAPTAVALPCDDGHAMTLCRPCWELVRQIRAEAQRKAKAYGRDMQPLPRVRVIHRASPSTRRQKGKTTPAAPVVAA